MTLVSEQKMGAVNREHMKRSLAFLRHFSSPGPDLSVITHFSFVCVAEINPQLQSTNENNFIVGGHHIMRDYIKGLQR